MENETVRVGTPKLDEIREFFSRDLGEMERKFEFSTPKCKTEKRFEDEHEDELSSSFKKLLEARKNAMNMSELEDASIYIGTPTMNEAKKFWCRKIQFQKKMISVNSSSEIDESFKEVLKAKRNDLMNNNKN